MLTKKQRRVLDFIKTFSAQKKYAPSLEEIRKKFKLASVSTSHFYITKLKERGYLKKEEHKPRSIDVVNNKSFIKIPLVGTIAAGQPLEALETGSGTITLPRDDVRGEGKFFALKVAGSSMIDEGIFDGDTVIIKQQVYATNGQTVVAIINENEATLKKFYREKNRFRLQPANQTLLPIYTKEVEIRGVVVKVIRNFEIGKKEEKLTNKVQKNTQNNVVWKTQNNSFDIFHDTTLKLNEIYNENCIDLMKKIKDGTIDLIFADPPYNLSKSEFKMKFIKSGGADLNTNKGTWDKFSDDDFEQFTKNWLSECFRILKNNGTIWVAGTYHNIYLTGYIMKKLGLEILNEVLWHKSDATPNLSCTRFVADHENFIWARKGKGNIFNYKDMKAMNGGKQMRSIWTKGKTAGGKRIHPTQKPEWLLERVILSTSEPKSIVFDPFLGSGTTAVVAKKLNRSYLGSELDRDYFNKATERLTNTQICHNIT